jgi:hypothetical protein
MRAGILLIAFNVLVGCGKTATEAHDRTTDATSSSTDASAPDARIPVDAGAGGDGGCYDPEVCLYCPAERKWRCQEILSEQCTDAETGAPCERDGAAGRSCFRCHPDGTGEFYACANRVWQKPANFACKP